MFIKGLGLWQTPSFHWLKCLESKPVTISIPYIPAGHILSAHQFSSVAQSCLTLWSHGLQYASFLCPSLTPRACSTHVHWICDAINHLILCHPLLLLPSVFPSIRVLFKWVSSSHQVAKVLELQLQHQSFQWIFRTISFRDADISSKIPSSIVPSSASY